MRIEKDRLTSDVKEVAVQAGASLVGIVSSKAADSSPRIWV